MKKSQGVSLISKAYKGVSLIELLVVIAVFSILAVLAASGIFMSLRGSRKSEAVSKVRENLDYSFAVMERHIRNAETITCSSSTQVDYDDKYGNTVYFSCESVGTGGYISSASARLTSDEIEVTACEFVCDPGDANVPPSVAISVTGENVDTSGIEGAAVDLSTKIFLRTY